MFKVRPCLPVLLALILACGPVQAAGWSLTDWIPGKKQETTTRSRLLGGKPLRSTARSQAREVSWWQRFTGGTKRAYERTKDALSFDDDEKGGSRPRREEPPRISRKSDDDRPFWSGWFQRDEPRPSSTIQDFLSQERPEQVP